MKHTEYEEQCKVVEYLRKVHPDVLFTASIAGHVKMTIPQWKRAVKAGYTKGTPDLMIFARGIDDGILYNVLFIEMKTKGGKLSKYQDAFLENALSRNYLCAVCNGYDSAVCVINKYLRGTL